MVEGALTSREHQRGNGTLPATKPKKVAESREKQSLAAFEVRFTPKSGHRNSAAECPLYAISRHFILFSGHMSI